MSIVSIIVLGCLYFSIFLVIVISVSGYLKRLQKPLIFFSASLMILILSYNSILAFANNTDGGDITAVGPSQTPSLLASPTFIPDGPPTPISRPALIPDIHPTSNPSPTPTLTLTPTPTPAPTPH